MTDLIVNLEKNIAAPIKKVFDAWLDPKILAKFMLPKSGMQSPDVNTSATEGGAFEIVMHAGENEIPHTGKYLEIKRPDKLVFTWESPVSTDDSVVTLNFTAVSEGNTLIKLSHVRFIDEERRADHESGWGHILEVLGVEV